MCMRGLIYMVLLMTIELSYNAEGEMLDKTAENLKFLKPAFEACVKVGNQDGILDSIYGILDAYYRKVFTPDLEGKVTKEQWVEVLTSKRDKEIELLNSYGVQEAVTKHLDTVYLQIGEFCKQNTGEADSDSLVIVWNDPQAFNRDIVASLFKFWESDEEVDIEIE